MKYSVPFRIIVKDPIAGVAMKVQKGKDKLLEPLMANGNELTFEFEVTVDTAGEAPNFLGPFAQGPKSARFIYVNTGKQAGQDGTMWDRRAKLSLMSISKERVESVLASKGGRFETVINGTGRDGGPVCATIKGLEWKVVKQ